MTHWWRAYDDAINHPKLLRLSDGLKVLARIAAADGSQDDPAEIEEMRVYVATRTANPKALIFGLVLLPGPQDPQLMPGLGLFSLMVIVVALMWGSAGRLTQKADDDGRRLLVVRRIASVWLAVVSVTLITSVIRA